MLRTGFLFAATAAVLVDASALPYSKPFEHLVQKRQSTGNSSLQVDLGYDVYEGVTNETTGLNTWKGYVYDKKLVTPWV